MVAVGRQKKQIDPTLGKRLRELREAKELTLVALGELAGMGYQEIARIERGEREPTWTTALRLADALGVSLDELREPTE